MKRGYKELLDCFKESLIDIRRNKTIVRNTGLIFILTPIPVLGTVIAPIYAIAHYAVTRKRTREEERALIKGAQNYDIRQGGI